MDPVECCANCPYAKGNGSITVAGCTLEPHRERLVWDGDAVHLTHNEVQLLALLMRAQGRVVSRELIRAHLWPDGAPASHESVARTHILSIRRAIRRTPLEIRSIRNCGYELRVADEERHETGAEGIAA